MKSVMVGILILIIFILWLTDKAKASDNIPTTPIEPITEEQPLIEPVPVPDFVSNLFGNSNIDNQLANITSDDTTWIDGYTLGDKIWVICNAIAHAEGANISGSVPDRLNNPGDITDGSSTFGIGFIDSIDNSKLTQFPDKATGWKWLYDKVNRIASDNSRMGVNSNSTWEEISQKWATRWRPWVNSVTSNLGVSSNSTIGQYLNS
jgi:hypothetical protein